MDVVALSVLVLDLSQILEWPLLRMSSCFGALGGPSGGVSLLVI